MEMTELGGPGRRRTFENEQAFQQITQILLDSGMSTLSLPILARRLGVTHQSLGKRFTSRSLMLRAYLRWMLDRYEESFQRAVADVTSPLERLWFLLILPIDSSITGREAGIPAEWIVLNLEINRDSELQPLMIAQNRAIVERILAAIRESISAGLIRDVDPGELAERLYTATLGGAVYWLQTRDSVGVTRMERACAEVLRPLLRDPCDLPQFS